MAAMARRVWGRYLQALEARPLVTNIITGGGLGFFGDVICQKVVERQERMDWRRCFAMTTFGLTYSGFVSYWVYHSYQFILPRVLLTTPLREGLSCSVVDNLIHAPLIYTPAFYWITEVLQGRTTKDAIDAFLTAGPMSIVACWVMWVPYQAVNFGCIAPANRTAFMNVGCLVWNVILDYIASNKSEQDELKITTDMWTEEAETSQIPSVVLGS